MCLCLVCGSVGGVGGEWVGARVWNGGVVMYVRVWIICVDGRSRYLYIVLGGYMRILGASSVQSCCTIYYLNSLILVDYFLFHIFRSVLSIVRSLFNSKTLFLFAIIKNFQQ